MGSTDNLMVQNRSMLKEFVASIATMSGDLSNITAPPFVLDTKSTVELPQYWADHPSIFCAPAQSSDPAERAMLVLRWYLSSLRNQNYMGKGENEGLKKPLNAFLGELFIGSFEGEEGLGETRLVGEQVSHHPPITACRVWNETHGVIAEGYTRQTITFSGNVTIQQTGHALFKLSKHNDETYLIPLPTLKVRGVLTGAPYPELGGKYYIASTSGYHSVIEFSGKGWFSGKKNSLYAKVYHESEGEDHPLYSIRGQWNESFVIHDEKKDKDIEIFDVTNQAATASKLIVDSVEDQDPWETRRAWKDVIDSLNRGDMRGTSQAKSIVEQGQRNMRKDDEASNRKFTPVFFRSEPNHAIAEKLSNLIPGHNGSTVTKEKKDTLGVWVFEEEKWHANEIQKPYHGDLVPDNSQSTSRYSIDGRNSSDMWSYDENQRRSSVASIYSTVSSRRSSMTAQQSWPKLHGSSPSISGTSTPRSLPGTSSARASMDGTRDFNLSDMSLGRKSLDGFKLIAKDQPGPQHQQALHSMEMKGGSGVSGMSVEEKVNVEDFLRSQYTSDSRRGSRALGKSGLSQQTSVN